MQPGSIRLDNGSTLTAEDLRAVLYGDEDPTFAGAMLVGVGLFLVVFGAAILIKAAAAKGD
jgi:hypothetical protein